MHLLMTAPCLLGLEGLVADELRFMEAENVSAENGRVFFEGDEAMLARANINSRFLTDLRQKHLKNFFRL